MGFPRTRNVPGWSELHEEPLRFSGQSPSVSADRHAVTCGRSILTTGAMAQYVNYHKKRWRDSHRGSMNYFFGATAAQLEELLRRVERSQPAAILCEKRFPF